MLRLDRLRKVYPRVVALDDLSVELEPGAIGLVGSNGAGKSTLLKIVLGLTEPTSGSIQVFGLDVRLHGSDVRRLIGYMPEHDCLPPDVSATDFVSYMGRLSGLPPSAARERTAEVLRHVGLFEERYREIGGYSTGMKQRVKLAQALVHDPRLLLLDEPTNGLDPAGRDEMLLLIQRIAAEFGISVIMASHLLGEIERVCDHLVVIDSGRLLRSAQVAALTSTTGSVVAELDGEAGALAASLERAGYAVKHDRGRLAVEARGDEVFDAIRDGAVDHGLGIIRLERRRHGLEEIFSSEGVGADHAA
jgi:ABC-2 type transport system ATP-binding protein